MSRDAVLSYQPVDASGTLAATLSGELDLDRADAVRDSLAAVAAGSGCRYLLLDASDVSFLDSYALGALVSARNAAAACGVVLTLVNPSPPVRKALQVTGLGDVFGLTA